MKETNIEIINTAKNNSKKYLQKLNKYFVNQLHLEQDRSDPEFTFYWYKEEHLISDMGIDSDDGILIVLIDAKIFLQRFDLITNRHIEFLEEYEGEQLLCVEIYSDEDIEIVKSLTLELKESYRASNIR